jgi:copper chaperone
MKGEMRTLRAGDTNSSLTIGMGGIILIGVEGIMNSEERQLAIGGMSCGGCVKAVTRVLDGVGGVQALDVAVGRATVRLNLSQVSLDAVREALTKAGYPAEEARS